jgi:two-component system response regulator DevR
MHVAEDKRKPIRLLLVDDHEVVRIGLRTLFDRTDNIQVVGESGTMVGAVEEAVRLNPDVVLMDVRLPDGSGVEACRDIRTACPDTRVLFLTSFADDDAVLPTILAGAAGYLLKEIGADGLTHAIETVASGQSILDPAITRQVLTRMNSLSDPKEGKGEALSPQEQRVLSLVAEGKTNKEIASMLNLSDNTVKNYLGNVFQKLQVTRRSQAAAYFVKNHSSAS